MGNPAREGDRVGGDVAGEEKNLLPQLAWERGGREHGEHYRGVNFRAPDPAAHPAPPDVTCEPLAQRHAQRAVPAVQDAGHALAEVPGRPRDQQHAEQPHEPGACPFDQRLRLVVRHAQSIREVGALQLVAQVQLEELALHWLQTCERGPHKGAKFDLPGSARKRDAVICHLRRRRDPSLHPAVALVAGYRKQPAPQSVGLGQLRDLGCGDDESIVHRIGRVGWFSELGLAVRV